MNNFKQKKRSNIFSKTEYLFFILIIIIIFGLLFSLFTLRQSTDGASVSQLKSTSGWSIDSENTTISSEILWQVSTNFHSFPYWTAVGARTIGLAGASSQSLEVVDIETGQMLWTQDIQNVSGLTSVLDGYIVTGQTSGQSIMYLNESGEQIWSRNEELIRGFGISFFSVLDLLYLPTNVGVYEYASENGSLLRVIDNDMTFLGAFDRYTLWFNQTSSELYLLEARNNNLYWHIELNNTDDSQLEFIGATQNIFVLKIEDEMIVYSDDAQLLWQMPINHKRVTVVNGSIIVFNSPQIQFFNIATGIPIGEIFLLNDNNTDAFEETMLDTITASDNIIILTDGSAEDIVAIDYTLNSP